MKKLRSLLSNHWTALSQREQRALILAAYVLIPALVYWLLWQPATSANAKLAKELPQLRSQTAQLRQDAQEVDKLRHTAQPATLDINALKNVIEQTATQHQLRDALSSLDIQPPNAVRISAASIPFAAASRWLRELQQVQHIRIATLNVIALPETGMVNLNATLAMGGMP